MPSMTNTIIFVLGGPGASKGTQCSRLAQKYDQIHHISVGDVLRAESSKSSSEFAPIIAENMRNGTVGPMEVTVQLLRQAIEAAVLESHSNRPVVILLDGSPRKKDQLELFEAAIQPAAFAIYLECEDEVRLERLSHRAKQEGTTRQDDDPETIRKRFSTFIETTMPVIRRLENDRRLVRINGQGSADDTFLAIDSMLQQEHILEESGGEVTPSSG